MIVLLRMDGHIVIVVNDGNEAVATIDSFRPDVALLDIGMPELNGYEVAQRTRQRPLGTFVLRQVWLSRESRALSWPLRSAMWCRQREDCDVLHASKLRLCVS